MFLHVEGIGKIQADKWVVRNVDITQERFRKIAIAGETGSGKSTLLKMIAGLEHPDAGIAFFEGVKIKSPIEVLLPGQPGIAYLSQHFELRANYHVWELLSYANQLTDTQAQALYQVCRIDHLLQRRVEQLSGGEKQRIALARLLVQSPRLLLLDEPFSNLDPIHREVLKKVLEEITGELQITCILASHDPADTLGWADEILVMKDGEKRQQADPHTLYYHPADTYTAELFGPFVLFPPALAQQIMGVPAAREGLLFARPEQVRLSRQGKQRPVTIEKRVFNGMYHLLEVSLDQFRFPVKTNDGRWSKGDTAAVSLAEDYEPHYLL